MTNSDAVRLVADVLRRHGELPDSGGVCDCGWVATEAEDVESHAAAAVVAALGGLTQELSWRVGGVRGLVLDSTDAGDAEVVARRWVSGWTPEETHE